MLQEHADDVVQVDGGVGDVRRQSGRSDFTGRVEQVGVLRLHRGVVEQPGAVDGADLEAAVGVQGELEALGVHDGVMALAEENRVGEVGTAAERPVGDVMAIEVGGAGAAGEPAAFSVDGTEELS